MCYATGDSEDRKRDAALHEEGVFSVSHFTHDVYASSVSFASRRPMFQKSTQNRSSSIAVAEGGDDDG